MKKGIVVERNDDYVTLLTPDGQFLKANKQKRSYELGEEITFFQLSDTSEKEAKSLSIFHLKGIRNGVLAVLALMIILFTVLPVFNNDKVYAYMTIDINPSFELGLNEKLQVVLIEPMNEDGEKMLDDLKDWKNRKLSEVFRKIVDKSSDLGYMKDGKEIFVATVMADQEDDPVKQEMLADVEELKNAYEKKNYTVNAVESDAETRKKAANQGISTGKYIQLNPQIKDETAPEEKGNMQQDTEESEKEKIDENTDSAEQKSPAEEEEKIVPPASEKPMEKPEVKDEDLKERVPQKPPGVPEPPKDQVSAKEIRKEAEKRKKEAKKRWREEQKKKSSRDEDRDDEDDDDKRDRDRNDDDRNDEDRDDERDRDDNDDHEGSRSDRD